MYTVYSGVWLIKAAARPEQDRLDIIITLISSFVIFISP